MRRNGEPFGVFESPLLGEHNVRNALAAIAVGAHSGLDAATLAEGLRTFRGIKRRLETVGIAASVTVLDDFAHHPTAVHETLAALRTGYPDRRIWAVFEPRSATACRALHQEPYARAFGAADRVILAPLGRSDIPEPERLDLARLVADLRRAGRDAEAAPSVDAIVTRIAAGAGAGKSIPEGRPAQPF